MTRLDMQELHLEGTLPSELGKMSLLSKSLDVDALFWRGVSHDLICLRSTEDFALDENDLISTIPPELCELRDRRLEKFIVDCPTKEGRGVGNYSNVRIDDLLKMDGNCFTICRRGA